MPKRSRTSTTDNNIEEPTAKHAKLQNAELPIQQLSHDILFHILLFLPIYNVVEEVTLLSKFFYEEMFKKRLLTYEPFLEKRTELWERTKMYMKSLKRAFEKPYFSLRTERAERREYVQWGSKFVRELFGVELSQMDEKYLFSNRNPVVYLGEKEPEVNVKFFLKSIGACPSSQSVLAYHLNTQLLSCGVLFWMEPFESLPAKKYRRFICPEAYIRNQHDHYPTNFDMGKPLVKRRRKPQPWMDTLGGQKVLETLFIFETAYRLEFEKDFKEQFYMFPDILDSLTSPYDHKSFLMYLQMYLSTGDQKYKPFYDWRTRLLSLCLPTLEYMKFKARVSNIRFVMLYIE